MQKEYTCPKCGGKEYEVGEMRVSGGALSSIFDVENKAYTTITCKDCTYTELYKTSRSDLSKVLDYIMT